MKRIAVIGGGINGVVTAWRLAQLGHRVPLFEKRRLTSANSSSSTKLLHGGLRYLDLAQFFLVREGLSQRSWWIRNAPHSAHPLPILLPLYRDCRRSPFKVRLGLTLYDRLAGRQSLGSQEKLTAVELVDLMPELNTTGLLGGFVLFDGQVDDHTLGLWAAGKAQEACASVFENTGVDRVTTSGHVVEEGCRHAYDRIYNISGPWAGELLSRSGIQSRFRLSLVRGGHPLRDFAIAHEAIVEIPGEPRLELVETTENPQSLDDPIGCPPEDESYLLCVRRHYLRHPVGRRNIIRRFSGLRPLVASTRDAWRTGREYVIERKDRLITFLGAKWTASRALAEQGPRQEGVTCQGVATALSISPQARMNARERNTRRRGMSQCNSSISKPSNRPSAIS